MMMNAIVIVDHCYSPFLMSIWLVYKLTITTANISYQTAIWLVLEKLGYLWPRTVTCSAEMFGDVFIHLVNMSFLELFSFFLWTRQAGKFWRRHFWRFLRVTLLFVVTIARWSTNFPKCKRQTRSTLVQSYSTRGSCGITLWLRAFSVLFMNDVKLPWSDPSKKKRKKMNIDQTN